MERRPFGATFIVGATFIAAGVLSRGGAIVSEMISSASVLLAFPTNLKKRNAAAFCASNPSRAAWKVIANHGFNTLNLQWRIAFASWRQPPSTAVVPPIFSTCTVGTILGGASSRPVEFSQILRYCNVSRFRGRGRRHRWRSWPRPLNSSGRKGSHWLQWQPRFSLAVALRACAARRKSDLYAREKVAHLEQIRWSIGRWLRDEYDTTQPVPKRLADLVRKIEQLSSKSLSQRRSSDWLHRPPRSSSFDISPACCEFRLSIGGIGVRRLSHRRGLRDILTSDDHRQEQYA